MRYLNNPANIRYSKSNHWVGESDPDNGFCTFKELQFGLRALMVLLKRYINSYHLRSVGSIIKRFAPVCENDTCSYICFVRTFLRNHDCDPNDIKPFSSDFYFLIQAICYFESHTVVEVQDLMTIALVFKLVKSSGDTSVEGSLKFNFK